MAAGRSVGGRRRHNYASLAGVARRTFDHFASGRANRVSLVNKMRGAGSKTKTGKKFHQSGYTSKYDDFTTLYRRRAAPRRVARRVRAFVRRVKSVLDGEVALQVAVRPQINSSLNAPVLLSVGSVNTQNTTTLPGLYFIHGPGFTNGSNNGLDDVDAIFSGYQSSGSLANDTILEFSNAVWDAKVYASSSNTTSMFLDLYECVARKDIPQVAAGTQGDPNALFASSLPSKALWSGSGSGALTTSSLGVTPFDAPAFCEQWKIVKVRRIKLEPGATHSIQFRDPKHRKFEWQTLYNYATLRGVTRAFIPIVYGPPNTSGDIGSKGDVAINVMRNYHFRQISQSEPSAAAI